MKLVLKTIVYLGLMLTIGGCGSKGDTGDAGATGAAGMTSKSGLNCFATDSGSGTALTYYYNSIMYTSGDRFVACSISTGLGEYSHSEMYRYDEFGAISGSCIVTYDLDGVGSGFWSFSSQSGTTKTTYTDPGDSANGYSFTFSSGVCTTF